MTTVREHRGTLAESLATAREVADRAELVALITEQLRPFGFKVEREHVSVEPYAYDSRVDQQLYIVKVAGLGVWGFAHGPLDEPAKTTS